MGTHTEEIRKKILPPVLDLAGFKIALEELLKMKVECLPTVLCILFSKSKF